MLFISRFVKLSCAVIAMSALCVFGARANQSTGWPTSDCEPSCHLNLVGNGCFTLSPEPDDPGHPMYKRGQCVIVGFEPDENYAFEKWTCDPPSHLASGNTSPVTGVFITGSTTLEAKTRVTCPSSLRVRWFNEAGDVPKPPGAEYSDLSTWNGLPCEWRLPLTQEDLDADFEITAVPNAGYYTEWHSPFYGTSAGYRIGNTIKLRSTCSSPYIEAQFTQYNPHTDIFFTVDVDPVSMADIWTAQPDGMDPPYGSGYGVYKPNEPLEFRSRGGGVYQAISMTIIPKPDQYVSHVTYAVAGGGSGYAFGSSARNSNEVNKIECVEHLVKALNYVAHSVPGIRLNIEVDGHGVVTSEDFACSWNPRPGGSPDNYAANLVTMHASPNKLGLPSNGWAFDHWEVKGASGQYFVLGVTSDTLTQFMNWYTGPQDWTNVPDGQTTHSVKAVFVPEHSLQLLEPNLSPITDNHYSFDANTPGVCAVSSIASQDDIPCAGYQWTLDEIDGSELSWSPSPPDVYNPVATFTGLPCENNQFGLKLLTVSRADGSELQEQLVEIFFNEVAKNHPEIPDNEVRNMIATDYGGKYDVPNWFYYWRQTSACYGADHLLAEHSRTVWNYPDRPNQWCARVGADANGGYVFHLNAYAPRLDEEYTWCSLGIDTYAFALRHESNHVVLFSLWWPIGVYNVPGYSPFDAYFKLHSPDYDYIPTDVEAGLGYDLEVPDSNHDGQYDEEDYITRTQALWILGAAGIEDWSDTGQQSHY